MIKKLFLVLLLLKCSSIYAQTVKTDILVIGGGPSGTAAAIQGARSKLKTLLIEGSSQLCPTMASQAMVTINNNNNLPSGSWGEFRKRIMEFYKATPGYDTSFNAALHFEPYTGAAIIRKITDTVKNLTVKLNASFTSIKKDGDGWAVTITQEGKSQLIKTKVVIDASANASVAEKLKLNFTAFDFKTSNVNQTSFRTSIATGENFAGPSEKINNYPQLPAYCVPLHAIVAHGADNLLITGKFFPDDDLQYLPNQLTLGQGIGATAAFCAFFKTTTQKLNVRTIQGELLDFKGYLVPFADIKQSDPYLRPIQQIGATGLLKGILQLNRSDTPLFFMPDSAVTTAEIEPVLNDIYTRTFLWFNREKPGAKFTVGNLLSLISEITLTDPQTLKSGMAKSWKTQYKFTINFDMNRPATRREFAVLINKYLNPFAQTVDLNGRFVN
jgi:hypothetical protein